MSKARLVCSQNRRATATATSTPVPTRCLIWSTPSCHGAKTWILSSVWANGNLITSKPTRPLEHSRVPGNALSGCLPDVTHRFCVLRSQDGILVMFWPVFPDFRSSLVADAEAMSAQFTGGDCTFAE